MNDFVKYSDKIEAGINAGELYLEPAHGNVLTPFGEGFLENVVRADNDDTVIALHVSFPCPVTGENGPSLYFDKEYFEP